MTEAQKQRDLFLLRIMAWLGVAATVLTVLLRVWLAPAVRDWETGLFTTGNAVIAMMVLVVAALFVLSKFVYMERQEIGGRPAIPMTVAFLAVGVAVMVLGVAELIPVIRTGLIPNAQTRAASILGLLEIVFALLGGGALVRIGLVLAAEGATRRGMAQWSALAPALWMWFRLAAYEAAYTSTVRMSDSFFYFVMFIVELVFLFKLARYTAGVGKTSMGVMLFWSMTTVMFSLSAPIVRLFMYLLQDSEAYLAGQQAGVADAVIGLLALATAVSLIRSAAQPDYEEASPADEESAE